MSKIIGNTTATPNPRPDWNQTDETKADFIKNKPQFNTEDLVIKNSISSKNIIASSEVACASIKIGDTVLSENTLKELLSGENLVSAEEVSV
jgi:hypothetical protein